MRKIFKKTSSRFFTFTSRQVVVRGSLTRTKLREADFFLRFDKQIFPSLERQNTLGKSVLSWKKQMSGKNFDSESPQWAMTCNGKIPFLFCELNVSETMENMICKNCFVLSLTLICPFPDPADIDENSWLSVSPLCKCLRQLRQPRPSFSQIIPPSCSPLPPSPPSPPRSIRLYQQRGALRLFY